MKNKFSLNLCGTDLNISSEDDERYVKRIEREINDSINKLTKSVPDITLSEAILLFTLNVYDDYKKGLESSTQLRLQLKKYAEENGRMKLELDKLKREASKN